jgi:hypothetical protein
LGLDHLVWLLLLLDLLKHRLWLGHLLLRGISLRNLLRILLSVIISSSIIVSVIFTPLILVRPFLSTARGTIDIGVGIIRLNTS